MKTVYDKLISAAHAKGLLDLRRHHHAVRRQHATTARRTRRLRQEINTYIKSGAFDGVIDFDAAVTDGSNPPKLQRRRQLGREGRPAPRPGRLQEDGRLGRPDAVHEVTPAPCRARAVMPAPRFGVVIAALSPPIRGVQPGGDHDS